MKMMAFWFREGRGLALGILIGALTLGKASPYLVNAIGSADWRINLVALSVFAAIGGAIALAVGEGPFAAGVAPLTHGRSSTSSRIAACGWRRSDTSAICGSSTRCGRGSR
jgi:hypothetical protein